MGPKRIGLAKEPSGQIDTPKKKITVSVASNKSLPEKNKESSSVPKKRAVSSSLKVTSHQNLAKPHNVEAALANQPKKVNRPESMVHSKSTPRNPSRTSGVNSNKKTMVTSVSNVSAGIIQREKNQNVVAKEASGSLGKNFGKNKTGQKPNEARTAITTSLHPVAFIKDESKIFKDKIKNKTAKSSTASSISSSSTINIESTPATLSNRTEKLSVNDRTSVKNDTIACKETTIKDFRQAPLKDIIDNNIRGSLENEDLNDEPNGDCLEINYTEDNSYRHFVINCEEKAMDKGDGHNTVCKSNIELSRTIGGPALLSPSIEFEFNRAENVTSVNIDNSVKDSKKNNDYSGDQSDRNSSLFVISDTKYVKTPYLPSFFVDSIKHEIEGNEKKDENNLDALINQSSDTTLMKTDVYDESLEPKASWATIDLETPCISLRDMKPSQSVTTMKSSFDGKTFIVEDPIIIRNLTQNFIEIDEGNSKKSEIETELTSVGKEELSSSASVKSVLQVNESVRLNDNSDPSPAETVTSNIQTPEKDITDMNDEKPDLEVKANNEYKEFENNISDLDTFRSDHVFDSADCLDVLNLDEMTHGDNYTVDLSNIVLRNFLNKQDFQKPNPQLFDDSDEFDMESEEVVHTVDISNCVWMDCKIQLNKPKPDGSDVWVFEEEDTMEDNIGTSDLVLIDSDEQDWFTTERKLHEISTSLDECEQEAKNALRELNRLSNKNQGVTKGKSYSHNNRNKSSKKMNKIKEINVDDIKIVNVSESISNQDFSTTSCNNYGKKSGLAEDEIDYFSVSSGDEMNEFEDDKIPEAKPQKSYLSFGKSCVKLKKKNEKRIFLSFFNLFK